MVQARLFAAEGDREDAAAAIDQSIAWLEPSRSNLGLAHALATRAALRAQWGMAGEAGTDRARATQLFEAMGALETREGAAR
jgi:hypothetical protein